MLARIAVDSMQGMLRNNSAVYLDAVSPKAAAITRWAVGAAQ